MAKHVVLTTPGFVSAIQGKDIPDADLPPPGLLLSLGDGSAVEVTDEMLLLALNAPHDGSPLDDAALCKAIIAALIQQAQEARDA